MADAFKQQGNTAFAQGQYEQAIASFSEAIKLDSSNHVLYSNRSAANAALKKFDLALEDAEETIKLQPTWSKGYGRKGAALHGLNRFTEAEEAYNKGLELEPSSTALQKGLEDVRVAASPPSLESNLLNPFASEEAMGRLFTDPGTRQFIAQPDFIQKINEIRQNPSALSKHMQDQRIMQAMFVAMGLNASFGAPPFPKTSPASASSSESQCQADSAASSECSKASCCAKENSGLKEENLKSCKEAACKESVSAPKNDSIKKPSTLANPVEEIKNKGNAEFKKKNFEAALSYYDEALSLEPDAIPILLNKSAVYFEQQNWDECIKVCLECIERGRSLRMDFKLIAKAFGRIGSAYLKMEMPNKAVEYFNKSLAEHRSPEILEKLKETEKNILAAKKAAYFSPELSDSEREKGNELFKKGEFVEALNRYTEAIARNDKDPRGYSNRAACYTKLAAFHEAIRDCDRCIELDPSFIKAYLRKASILYGLKEYQKCLDTCFEAKSKDTENRHSAEIEQHLAKCYLESQKASMNESSEETLQRAMADPEIRSLMTDPVMQSILQQMQSDPRAIHDHMKNPLIANKIRKLMAAGIIRTA
ncbi:Hsp90 cochaperone [Mitosporidium daphniae]|uniref:STI1 domain-containing protein n=1 Tax=Mitosporidium daphniae TaxID=1485682 RepID=A0A098VNR6_9MICR|nr:uncharacterized protein DI09_59p120 [Mitosporidium daphniae]KGG50722.1 hypothetical protein DI09_59p120 [Mitosporidium daphniae]|eukprot:XP_013237149.1 uncharacterized protein DI09_59p120 [Mitosporidium daphniae]